MRGRWAAGIVPRNFAWVIKDRLAVSERPGGYAPNHRKVRRQEELLWLRAQGFSRIVSLLGSSHNLHAYDEFNLAWSHFALPGSGAADIEAVLNDMYPAMYEWLRAGEKLLVHQDELGDRLMGVVAGYVRWSGILPDGPRAITVVEQILTRQMGSAGRVIVAMVPDLVAPPAHPHGGHSTAAPAGPAAPASSASPALPAKGSGQTPAKAPKAPPAPA